MVLEVFDQVAQGVFRAKLKTYGITGLGGNTAWLSSGSRLGRQVGSGLEPLTARVCGAIRCKLVAQMCCTKCTPEESKHLDESTELEASGISKFVIRFDLCPVFGALRHRLLFVCICMDALGDEDRVLSYREPPECFLLI